MYFYYLIERVMDPVEKKAKASFVEQEPRVFLLSECEVVSEVPSDLTCTICLSAFSNPVQCNGGHVYCRDCITPISRKAKARCPVGNEQCKINKLLVVPAAVGNALHALHIKCPLLCGEWIGAFDKLSEHVKICTYRTAQCSGCKADFIVKDLKSHENTCSARPVECVHCGLLKDIKHVNHCVRNPDRLVPCSCGILVPISEQEKHIASLLAARFIIINRKIEALSKIHLRWKLMLTDGDTYLASDCVKFAGLSWYLYIRKSEKFSVYLRARNTNQNVLVIRNIHFKITIVGYDSRTLESPNGVGVDNRGRTQNPETETWIDGGHGFKNVFSPQIGIEYEIICRIKIIN